MGNFVSHSKSHIELDGDLTFATIKPLYEKVKTIFVPEMDVTVGLQKVTLCDSASLVLLLAIVQRFHNSNFQVRFTHLPQNLMTLINLYNLSDIIKCANHE